MNISFVFLIFFCFIGITITVKNEIEVDEINCAKVRVELAFDVDASSSITNEDFISEKKFIGELSNSFDIGQDKSRIALVTFADTALIVFGFTKYNTSKEVNDGINTMKQMTGVTALGASIKLTGEGVMKEARTGIPKYIVVITDGVNNRWPKPSAVTPTLKQDGIIFISVGVGDSVDAEELKGISSSNTYHNVSGFNQLGTVVENIRKEICKVKVKYELKTCESTGDIAFIIDAMNPNYLKNQVDLVSKVLNRFEISQTKQRVSIIVDGFGTLVPLDKFGNRNDYIKYLSMTKFDVANKGESGMLAADKVLTENRIDVPKLAVLFRTYVSTNHSEDLKAALNLRNRGTNVLVVGLGSNINENDLNELSSTKKTIHPSTVTWDESYVNEISEIFCQNLKKVYKECSGKKIDLVFVLDSSSSVGPDNWLKQLQFVTRIVSMLDVSNGTTKLGAVYFNSEAYLGFEIGKYDNKKDNIDSLVNLPYSEGATAIGNALLLAQQQLTTRKRNESVAVIVLVTDGKSNVGAKPEMVATATKNEGTHIICIGITDQISKDQLQKLSSTKQIYEINDFESLEKFPVESLTKEACQAIKNERVECVKPAKPKNTEL